MAAVAPGVTPYAEKTLSTLVKTLADRPGVASELAQTSKLLGEPIAGVLMRRPEVLDILGIEKKAEARTQEAISRILKEKFNWTSTTTAGDIQSDLIVADTKTRNLINVDWTSSTKSDAFEKTWQKVVDDLGANFDGNWDKLSDAYRRAFKGEIPQDVKDKLVKLTQHAARETVVRKVLIEEILGKLWNVRSHEMIYDGLAKLWNPDFLKGK